MTKTTAAFLIGLAVALIFGWGLVARSRDLAAVMEERTERVNESVEGVGR